MSADLKKVLKLHEVFQLSINGKFSQYLKPSETKLLKWEAGVQYTLMPIKITHEKYCTVFGLV